MKVPGIRGPEAAAQIRAEGFGRLWSTLSMVLASMAAGNETDTRLALGTKLLLVWV
jgi:hypothetical protein